MVAKARADSGGIQEFGASCRPPTRAAGVDAFVPSSTISPRLLAESWTRSGTARTQTGAHMAIEQYRH